MKLLPLLLAVATIAPGAPPLVAQETADPSAVGAYYRIERVASPKGIDPQVGGIDVLPGGRVAVAFHSGEIFVYDPPKQSWSLFAAGLHEPLGVLAVRDDQLLVMQKPELTRISDTDRDGRADDFETVSDAFGFSGNYHEFAFGPVRDARGNLYISLNDASNATGIPAEVRGEFRSLSASREQTAVGKFPNKMFSVVPYRGWVLKITPDGKTLPFASGLRSPNGLLVDPRGRLFVTDNQGDWLGTGKMYHVEEGKFYGHPVSLIWKDGWKRDPLEMDLRELDRMRTREVVAFPHELMANSPTQPVVIPPSFGPFAGQLLVGEMNQPRLIRIMLEEVGGALQGAVVPMIDGMEMGQGNNRLAFAADGSLWVGKTHLKWPGAGGIRRVVPTGRVPMEVLEMKLTDTGFELSFTHPVDRKAALDPASYRFRRYYYAYHQKYGSPQMDTARVPVTRAHVSDDGRRVRLDLAELRPGYLHELELAGLRAADGTTVLNPLLVYTLNRLVDGTGPAPGFDVGAPRGTGPAAAEPEEDPGDE